MDATTVSITISAISVVFGGGSLVVALIKTGRLLQRIDHLEAENALQKTVLADKANKTDIASRVATAAAEAESRLLAQISTRVGDVHEKANRNRDEITQLRSRLETMREGIRERLEDLDSAEEKLTAALAEQVAQKGKIERLERDCQGHDVKLNDLNREIGEVKAQNTPRPGYGGSPSGYWPAPGPGDTGDGGGST